MKLGTSGQENQYVAHHLIPSKSAMSETAVILSAYQGALDSLLAMTAGETSDVVMEGLYSNFVALREVRDLLRDDLERADVTMEAIEARLSI